MACSQTLTGILRDCDLNMGGIAEVYIANYDDISAKVVTDETISTITPVASAATPFHKYQFRKGTGNFASTLNVSAENGTRYVSTLITLNFAKMETAKRIEIKALSVNDLVVIVKDANGTYWYFGYDEPVSASAGTGNTGTARGDANAYGVTLQDNAAEWPYEVNGTIVDALVSK